MLSSETVCSAIICINHLMLVYMLSNFSREMEVLVAAVRVPLCDYSLSFWNWKSVGRVGRDGWAITEPPLFYFDAFAASFFKIAYLPSIT